MSIQTQRTEGKGLAFQASRNDDGGSCPGRGSTSTEATADSPKDGSAGSDPREREPGLSAPDRQQPSPAEGRAPASVSFILFKRTVGDLPRARSGTDRSRGGEPTGLADRAARRAEARRRRAEDRVIGQGRITDREAGMATAEYAIATLAAVGFAALLVAVLSSGEIKGLLMSLITSALSFG
ncbi:DUF4244 domain-containing protein [Arthrobacter sp. TMS1-12-1]